MKTPGYIKRGAQQVLRSGEFSQLVDKYRDLLDCEICANVTRLGFYLHQRKQGASHNIAAMTAMQAAPGSLTDREFFAGMGTLDQQFARASRTTSSN